MNKNHFFSISLFVYILSITAIRAGTVDSISFVNYSFNRFSYIYVPSIHSSSNPSALVINLHARGSNAFEQMNHSQFNLVADTANIIVAYPRALPLSGLPGWDFDYYHNHYDQEFILNLVDTIKKYYAIDPCKVYICGISMGGLMSYTMAGHAYCRTVFAAAGIVGGCRGYYLDNTAPFPVCIIHGTNDNTFSFEIEEMVPAYACSPTLNSTRIQAYYTNHCTDSLGFYALPNLDPNDNTTVEKKEWWGSHPDQEVWLYKVVNGGHAWPGGVGSFGALQGNSNNDIHASRELWKFFRRHVKCGPSTSISEHKENVIAGLSIFPNPANGNVIIKYNAEKNVLLDIAIIDLLGNTVDKIESGNKLAGEHSVLWNSTSIKSGLYILKFVANEQVLTQKIIVQ